MLKRQKCYSMLLSVNFLYKYNHSNENYPWYSNLTHFKDWSKLSCSPSKTVSVKYKLNSILKESSVSSLLCLSSFQVISRVLVSEMLDTILSAELCRVGFLCNHFRNLEADMLIENYPFYIYDSSSVIFSTLVSEMEISVLVSFLLYSLKFMSRDLIQPM